MLEQENKEVNPVLSEWLDKTIQGAILHMQFVEKHYGSKGKDYYRHMMAFSWCLKALSENKGDPQHDAIEAYRISGLKFDLSKLIKKRADLVGSTLSQEEYSRYFKVLRKISTKYNVRADDMLKIVDPAYKDDLRAIQGMIGFLEDEGLVVSRDVSPASSGQSSGAHQVSPASSGESLGVQRVSPASSGESLGVQRVSPASSGQSSGAHQVSPADTVDSAAQTEVAFRPIDLVSCQLKEVQRQASTASSVDKFAHYLVCQPAGRKVVSTSGLSRFGR
jgi:hypothetical protein